MADQTQRLEIATVRAEVGSNIVFRFANDEVNADSIPTQSGDIQNLKQVVLEIQQNAAEKISISTTIYPSVAAGLAATADQGIFLVQSNDADEIYSVWQNQGGTAVNTGKTALSATAIQTALDASNEAAQAAENSAEVATERTIRYLAPSEVQPETRDNGLPLQIGDVWFSTQTQTEYRYTAQGWRANDSQQAIDELSDQIATQAAPSKIPRAQSSGQIEEAWIPESIARSAYGLGTIETVLDGVTPFGPEDQRVDQISGGNALPGIGGPFIRRPWCTTKPIILFVDPASGSDSNTGTQDAPLRTITAAIQQVPQNIYHKVRIYLLDGDYGNENIKAFNYYVSARGTAGFRIIGHIANYDGDIHPIYNDDNPSAVVLGGNEHVISGIAGTEEFAIAGVTFKNGWIENYDTVTVLYRCKFNGGHTSQGYSTHHAIGGHASMVKCVYVDFDNLASIGSFSDFVTVLFEQCTLGTLTTNSDHYVNGIPFQVGDNCEVLCKNSPTLLKKGPNGKAIINAGGRAYDANYSSMGYSIIRRSAPTRDESIAIVAHDGTLLSNNRGAGAEFYGEAHPVMAGRAIIGFGPSSAARAYVQYCGSAASGGSKNVAEFTPLGDVKAYAALSFGANGAAITSLLKDGQAAMWVHTNGDVRMAVKVAGVTRWAKIFDYASATPF